MTGNRLRERDGLPMNGLLAMVLVALSMLFGFSAQAGEQADELLRRLALDRGLCVILNGAGQDGAGEESAGEEGAGQDGANQGDASYELALEVAQRSELLVYVQVADATMARRARVAAAAVGLGGDRFYVAVGPLEQLHLASNLADVVVVLGKTAGQVAEAEVLRILRPRGKAWLDLSGLGSPGLADYSGIDPWRQLTKPVPAGTDDWTHPYHGPDNNPVSRDQLIQAPYLTQFLANPRYGPAPQATVAAAGRVFKAFGHVAWHQREEPLLDTLVAYSGYNGTELWRRKLPEGLMLHRSTFIATEETLYLGDDRSCKLIDTETGQMTGQIQPPVDLAGGTFWKWMGMEDGVLFALTGGQENRDQEMKWRRRGHGWPWNEISKGYNEPVDPWGFGQNILAIDPKTQKVLWHYHEDEPIDGRTVCMRAGRLFAFRFGRFLTCLDTTDGSVVWRKTPANAPKLFEALGNYQERQGWQTNWRTIAYLKCSDQALYFAGPQLERTVAVSTADGSLLWTDPYDNYQLILHPKGLYGISGSWGINVSKKFDPLTGQVLAELPVGRRACTRPNATAGSILFRAMGGSIRFDLDDERPRWVSPMRPSCHDGVTVANGLLYWWPYVCDCQLSLYGVTCVGSAGDFDFTPKDDFSARLQADRELVRQVADLSATPADWPTFRANNRATATTAARVPAHAHLQWTASLVGGGLDGGTRVRPTAPVAVGDLVLLAGSDGVVRALDAATGKRRWQVSTGAEIRFPPTVWKGRALVGSGDGWVYAFEAHSGREAWRFRAAPAERLIPVYGRLQSTWPAASGVRVGEDGVAYVAAGLANYDGTYVYALDAASGQVRWCNDTSGHLDAKANTGVSVQGHLLIAGDRLYLAGGNAVSPGIYDLQDGRCLNDPAPLAECQSTSPRGWELSLVGDRVVAFGRPLYARPENPVYDRTVKKKILHARSGSQDVVWLDNRRLMGFAPLDSQVLSRCVSDEKIPKHITQTWGEFEVDQKPLWRHEVPGSEALAVGANAVVVADHERVTAYALAGGGQLWSVDLPAAPVPWGMAINRHGQTLVTLVDGRVVCLGE